MVIADNNKKDDYDKDRLKHLEEQEKEAAKRQEEFERESDKRAAEREREVEREKTKNQGKSLKNRRRPCLRRSNSEPQF